MTCSVSKLMLWESRRRHSKVRLLTRTSIFNPFAHGPVAPMRSMRIRRRTNERTKFICQWTDWTLSGYQYRPKPIKAGHQKKETDKLIKRERQRKKYIVIHTRVVEKYKEKLDTRITSPHIRPRRGSEIQSYRHVFGQVTFKLLFKH